EGLGKVGGLRAMLQRVGPLVGDKNTVPMTVKAGGQAMLCDVVVQQAKIAHRRFVLDKAQGHQFAGGIIDKDQQRAARRTPLEPVMGRSVDLNEFASARSTCAQRMDRLVSTCAGSP